MDTSNWISIGAAVIAAAGIWFNWRHTNKTFQRASNPELEISSDIRNKDGQLWLKLDNLHTSTTASNLKCVVSFRLHDDAESWTDYHERQIPPIKPLTSFNEVLPHCSLVKAISDKHPDFMHIQEVPKSSGRFDNVLLRERQDWDVRITVTYRGALSGSNLLTATKQLLAQPVSKKHSLTTGFLNEEKGTSLTVIEHWTSSPA